jgi:hypothetical protein
VARRAAGGPGACTPSAKATSCATTSVSRIVARLPGDLWKDGLNMMDLLYILLAISFFALCATYVRGCAKL